MNNNVIIFFRFCGVRRKGRKSKRHSSDAQESATPVVVSAVSGPPKTQQRRKKGRAPSPPRVVRKGDSEGVDEYPEQLNPFRDCLIKGERSPVDDYPEELNPFFEDDDLMETEQDSVDYPEELNPFRTGDGKEGYGGDNYPEHLNPFGESCSESKDYPEQLNPFGDSCSESVVPLPSGGHKKWISYKKCRAPSPPRN